MATRDLFIALGIIRPSGSTAVPIDVPTLTLDARGRREAARAVEAERARGERRGARGPA